MSPGCRRDTSREVSERLREAERAGRCLAATSDSLYRALRTRVLRGEVISPFPRLFARSDRFRELSAGERARHILLGAHELHPEWAFCGVSAAVLHGLQVPYALLDGIVHLAAPKGYRSSGTVLVRKHPVDGRDVEERDGVRMTTLLRTALDCARSVSFRYGVAIADSSLAVGRCCRDELVDYAASRRRGLRGVARARAAAAFADVRSANGGESVARAVMYELGFAAPDLQVRVDDPIEPWRYFVADFAWRGCHPRVRLQGKGTAPGLAVPAGLDALGGNASVWPGAANGRTARGRRGRGGDGRVVEGGFARPVDRRARRSEQAVPVGVEQRGGRIIGELDGVEKYFDPVMNRGEGVEGALLRERRRESRLTLEAASVVRFSYADVLNLPYFAYLLESYGVPYDHEPLVRVSPYILPIDGEADYLPQEAFEG